MKQMCSFENCGAPSRALGLCGAHRRQQKLGHPLKQVRRSEIKKGDVLQWLLSHVSYEAEECLLWPFSLHTEGYGLMRFHGKSSRAHRVMCRLAHGEPEIETLQAAHNCGNRLCVNPKHLRWATRLENKADELAHGTRSWRERHGNAKLTEADVIAIRKEYGPGVTKRRLAVKFNISPRVIYGIIHGTNWSSL